MLKRILAFLGAGVCVLACMLTMSYSLKITAYARDFDEYYSYNSIEHNVKVSNNGGFSENIVGYPLQSSITSLGITFNFDYNTQNIYLNGKLNAVGHSQYWFMRNKIIPKGVYQVYSNGSITNVRSMMYFVMNNTEYWLVSMGNLFGLGAGIVEFTEDTKVSFCLEVHSSDTHQFSNYAVNVGLYKISDPNDRKDYFIPYQQNDFISFTNTLNVGIEKNSSAWLLEQCVFNNLRTSDNNYYMKSSIEDSSLQNVIYYNSNNIKGNFMFKDFFKYKDNVIDENNYFRIFVNFDYIESSDYDSTSYFNGNVQKIIYGSHKNWETYKSLQVREKPSDWGTQYAKFNFISYVDNNGNNCNIYFPLISDNDNDYYELRTLFVNTNGLTDYSDGYNDGYMNGKNDGYASGEKTGYQNGYKKGKTDGYNSGYSYGVRESNDYTFLGLISACIDAPISYFTSLFNFELLGFNLSSFFKVVFTICVIVTIIRLCFGRK